MIKLKIKRELPDKSIIEEIIDFDGTYDGKMVSQDSPFDNSSISYIPILMYHGWEVIEEIKN